MADIMEKSHSEHVEQASSSHDGSGNIGTDAHGFAAEAEELPKGYYYSPYFVGTTVAIGLNLMVSNPCTCNV
jgi:hypothetical protein